MHPCLLIDEIVQNVAAHVEYGKSRRSMALTCRAFFEPAVARLWAHSLEGLKPLVRCLPEDAVSEHSDKPRKIVR